MLRNTPLKPIFDLSPFASRVLSQNTELEQFICETLDVTLTQTSLLSQIKPIKDEHDLKKQLRQLRQYVFLHTMARDILGLANLHEVVAVFSTLAEIAIVTSLNYLQAQWAKKFVIDLAPHPLFIVIAMGKLGGRELNASSDIDLIFAIDEHDTAIQKAFVHKSISPVEFFTHIAKSLIRTLDDITEDGFVFRVDMRLRPFGKEGVLLPTLDMLETYYQSVGREWERFAWIKGRIITGDASVISQIIKPFVFRKYLDYGAIDALRHLKSQISLEIERKGLQNNIKLGSGGIREIEFIVQTLQLIRGGQNSALQIPATLEGIDLLQQYRWLSRDTAISLKEAYIFLRNLEHRLQYQEDQQTQELPKNAESLLKIARAMGEVSCEEFIEKLNYHRHAVAQEFNQLFGEKKIPQEMAILESLQFDISQTAKLLSKLNYPDPQQVIFALQSLQNSSQYKQLSISNQALLNALINNALQEVSHFANESSSLIDANKTFILLLHLFQTICRRAPYLKLFAEHTALILPLIRLCVFCPWLIRYLTQHPVLLDELLDAEQMYAPPDFFILATEIEQKLSQIDEDDVERQMDVLRHFKHQCVFRFIAQSVNAGLSIMILSDYLSNLACLILKVSLDCLKKQIKIPIESPFTIIAYGKLGAYEMGIDSDLDLVFLYEETTEVSVSTYTRLAQKLCTWLSNKTYNGSLYETDVNLRPNGASGLLVSDFASFLQYQEKQAWTWEHQALTRAKFVAGNQQLGLKFEKLRCLILSKKRDLSKLKLDIRAMREKMQENFHDKPSLFHLKQSRGGMIDIEFIVQFFILGYAHAYAELLDNVGIVSLLKRLSVRNLISSHENEQMQTAYLYFREQQHLQGLQEIQSDFIPSEKVLHLAQIVLQAWQKLFES